MYVSRERRSGRLIFWLVESRRQDGKVRTHKLAYLGTLRESYEPWRRQRREADLRRFITQAYQALCPITDALGRERFAAQLRRLLLLGPGLD